MATNRKAEAAPGMRCLLVATDLSSRSDRALRRAALLAQTSGAELLLLHAVDDDQPPSMVELERQEARRLLSEQIAGLPELQASGAVALIEEGDAFEAVLRLSDARSVDLVVLGEHRRRPLRDIFVGTTLERVMRYGRRPILMVHQPVAAPYRRVLAVTDFSEHSARALKAAERLGLLAGVELDVLHAFEPPYTGALALADVPEVRMRAHAAQARREAGAVLARFLDGLGLERPPRALIEEGQAATVIQEAVARLHPDLLVIGTTGAGALRRAMIGSVAAEVLAQVPCDALALPPEEAR